MKVLNVKDRKVASKLADRLVKKGLVVAQAEHEEELKKTFPRKADVVILVSDRSEEESESVAEALD